MMKNMTSIYSSSTGLVLMNTP